MSIRGAIDWTLSRCTRNTRAWDVPKFRPPRQASSEIRFVDFGKGKGGLGYAFRNFSTGDYTLYNSYVSRRYTTRSFETASIGVGLSPSSPLKFQKINRFRELATRGED